MLAKKNTVAKIDGILNVNKPTDRTSQDVVSYVKHLTKQRHVGHAGTLDPIATGVLPVCLGQATRMSSFIMESHKTYIAEIKLGISTNTYDREGTVTSNRDPSYITKAQVIELLPTLTGTVMQKPPSFSALKLHGKRLYELARSGIEVETAPREVTIYRMELLQWNHPSMSIEVECSKGTYIRSIAHDIGQSLGCGAHIAALIRTKYGPFSIEDSISLTQIEDAFSHNLWQRLIYPMDIVINDWTAVTVTPEQEHAILDGRTIPNSIENATPRCRAYSCDGWFLAILKQSPDKATWHPEKVFHSY